MKIRTWQGDLSSTHVYLGLLGNLPHGCPIYTESLNPSSYWNNRHVENHEVASLSHARFACFRREIWTRILEVLREDCGVSSRLETDTWYERKCSSAQALQVATASCENCCWLSIRVPGSGEPGQPFLLSFLLCIPPWLPGNSCL